VGEGFSCGHERERAKTTSTLTLIPLPPSPAGEGGKVPLPRERDLGRGHFQLHSLFRLAITTKIQKLNLGIVFRLEKRKPDT
jgi:hypothetical protein